MKQVYAIASNIVSPLGHTTAQHIAAVMEGQTGVKKHQLPALSGKDFYASLFPGTAEFTQLEGFTRFENLLVASIKDALSFVKDGIDDNVGLIISSTKGNISLLEKDPGSPELKKEVSLSASAKKVAGYFGFTTHPVIVSHACISGLIAIITAKRLIDTGKYKRVVVAGADLITQFILSGFQSFHAVSDDFCKPFDANRTGINLGEAAATLVLSDEPLSNTAHIIISGGAVSNDANHISGPSRTGEELHTAIEKAMQQAGVAAADIDFISAHGTATVYNDDMESKAFHLSQLNEVPVNSLKGYFGHTLGAAGLLETVISIASLQENIIIPTKGFEQAGTAENINVCRTLQHKTINTCLKTASGFGGCNAAIIIRKS